MSKHNHKKPRNNFGPRLATILVAVAVVVILIFCAVVAQDFGA